MPTNRPTEAEVLVEQVIRLVEEREKAQGKLGVWICESGINHSIVEPDVRLELERILRERGFETKRSRKLWDGTRSLGLWVRRITNAD